VVLGTYEYMRVIMRMRVHRVPNTSTLTDAILYSRTCATDVECYEYGGGETRTVESGEWRVVESES
jgi:hypothetical protein